MTIPSSTPPSPAFVICRALLPGESLASFVQWHCTENVVTHLSVLFRLLAECGGEWVHSIHELAHSAPTLRALERVTRLPAGTLEHLRVKVLRAAVDGGEERRIVQGAYEWPHHSRSLHLQAVCPHCLRETGYARADWEFVQAPVCTQHGVQLVDRCPDCGDPLDFLGPELTHCAACSTALETATATPVDEPTLSAARLVVEPRTRAFGTEAYTVPIEPQELSGLLRLLLLPRFGQSVDHGLTGDLEKALSIEQRAEALRLLGSALVGPRVDSARLRAIALRRWPYAPLLVLAEEERLLQEACRAVALLPEVTRMLCSDSDWPRHPDAAAVYAGRPPSIVGVRQLADHLALERPALEGLLAWERLATHNPPGHGYDMDEVLELERVLRSMLPVAQVDQGLGWPGATEELVGMKVLAAFCTVNGGRGIHPRSISQLFERVHARVDTALTCHCASMSLGAARELGFDARRFAWAVVQVIGGSLPVHDWEPPYDLLSLQVCERRLRELATWPQSEVAWQGCPSLTGTADGSPATPRSPPC